ncbi:MAG: aminopeptidase [Tannerellaceae bacterium]|nr:aminopeptidase [Tannerellaceae bacterium]
MAACSTSVDPKITAPGVSRELAGFRKANYERIHYKLFFNIPERKAEAVAGEVEISFLLKKRQALIIDFRAAPDQVLSVKLNGQSVAYRLEDEHIIIAANVVSSGENHLQIAFIPDDQSLNRRDEFLYTLLVPDRARTLFPCFDQPDLKSLFSLTLEIPGEWKAVSNSVIEKTRPIPGNKKRTVITYKRTEPLSTYLFSFVAGKLEQVPFERNKRKIAIYHRETDSLKVAQCPEIARQVFDALEWLEAYTGIPYPFSKYDLIILPGFQYGGMEHTGATLYTDKRMFLNEQPTLNEALSRSSLIAHETAHLWFGDYVTMKWFDDVWTKEVFANYFASRITEPLFPDINHRLNFMLDYFPPAYAEDRTDGSNPIKQPVDNLNNAGLAYGNIIYDKSPVVLNKLIRKIGEEAFRQGIHKYLTTYAYDNASWDDLVGLLNQYTEEDLKAWSHTWVDEKGMPTIVTSVENDSVVFTQSDPWQRGIVWQQDIAFIQTPEAIIPNSDGSAYGFFRLTGDEAEAFVSCLDTCANEVVRGSILITLYENVLNRTLLPDWYIARMIEHLPTEQNPLLFSLTLDYITSCQRLYPAHPAPVERALWKIMTTALPPQYSLQVFRQYRNIAQTPEAIHQLYTIWKEQKAPGNFTLSETDYIQLSYLLAISLPEEAARITSLQLARISNPDRIEEYTYVSPSVSPGKETRDSVFRSLLIAHNRSIEPWALTALSNLNHPLRQQEAVPYIRPALEILAEVQRTGDIFFPRNWARALLAGHTSGEAMNEVNRFFAAHPGYPTMLGNKIKQQADFLYRANSQNKE